jgi:hypothetical protein
MPDALYAALDDVIQEVAAPARADDVAAARKQWNDRRGRAFEDEHLWESWTAAFLEWYALERVPPGGIPLAALRLRDMTDPARATHLRAWLRSMRTMVEFLAIGRGVVEAVDLLGGAQFAVTEQRALAGVKKGDVAEVRLVADATVVRFGRTFTFHPTGTRDAILERIGEQRTAGKTRDQILDHFARLRIRCERYAHLTPARIYASQDDRVPELV